VTLILSWITRAFCVAACDGKAIIKHADGRIESAAEDVTKIHPVAPDIAIVCGGDTALAETLVKAATVGFVAPFGHEGPWQPSTQPEYFCGLELMVPSLCKIFCMSHTYEVPQDNGVILLGYDPRQKMMRGVGFDSNVDFEPVEIPLRTLVTHGWEDGKMLAAELVDLTKLTGPEATVQEFERVIREVGTRMPERINTNARSLVLRAPKGIGTGGFSFKAAEGEKHADLVN